MTTLQSDSELLKNAMKWIGAERQDRPEVSSLKLVEEAGMRFNLSPKDQEFLLRCMNPQSS